MLNIIMDLIKANPAINLIPSLLFIATNIILYKIGGNYDNLKRKIDPNYRGYHSYRFPKMGVKRYVFINYLKREPAYSDLDSIIGKYNFLVTVYYIFVFVFVFTLACTFR